MADFISLSGLIHCRGFRGPRLSYVKMLSPFLLIVYLTLVRAVLAADTDSGFQAGFDRSAGETFFPNAGNNFYTDATSGGSGGIPYSSTEENSINVNPTAFGISNSDFRINPHDYGNYGAGLTRDISGIDKSVDSTADTSANRAFGNTLQNNPNFGSLNANSDDYSQNPFPTISNPVTLGVYRNPNPNTGTNYENTNNNSPPFPSNSYPSNGFVVSSSGSSFPNTVSRTGSLSNRDYDSGLNSRTGTLSLNNDQLNSLTGRNDFNNLFKVNNQFNDNLNAGRRDPYPSIIGAAPPQGVDAAGFNGVNSNANGLYIFPDSTGPTQAQGYGISPSTGPTQAQGYGISPSIGPGVNTYNRAFEGGGSSPGTPSEFGSSGGFGNRLPAGNTFGDDLSSASGSILPQSIVGDVSRSAGYLGSALDRQGQNSASYGAFPSSSPSGFGSGFNTGTPSYGSNRQGLTLASPSNSQRSPLNADFRNINNQANDFALPNIADSRGSSYSSNSPFSGNSLADPRTSFGTGSTNRPSYGLLGSGNPSTGSLPSSLTSGPDFGAGTGSRQYTPGVFNTGNGFGTSSQYGAGGLNSGTGLGSGLNFGGGNSLTGRGLGFGNSLTGRTLAGSLAGDGSNEVEKTKAFDSGLLGSSTSVTGGDRNSYSNGGGSSKSSSTGSSYSSSDFDTNSIGSNTGSKAYNGKA